MKRKKKDWNSCEPVQAETRDDNMIAPKELPDGFLILNLSGFAGIITVFRNEY